MGLLLDVPEPGLQSEVSGSSTLNGQTNLPTPPARWAGAVPSVSPSVMTVPLAVLALMPWT